MKAGLLLYKELGTRILHVGSYCQNNLNILQGSLLMSPKRMSSRWLYYTYVRLWMRCEKNDHNSLEGRLLAAWVAYVGMYTGSLQDTGTIKEAKDQSHAPISEAISSMWFDAPSWPCMRVSSPSPALAPAINFCCISDPVPGASPRSCISDLVYLQLQPWRSRNKHRIEETLLNHWGILQVIRQLCLKSYTGFQTELADQLFNFRIDKNQTMLVYPS